MILDLAPSDNFQAILYSIALSFFWKNSTGMLVLVKPLVPRTVYHGSRSCTGSQHRINLRSLLQRDRLQYNIIPVPGIVSSYPNQPVLLSELEYNTKQYNSLVAGTRVALHFPRYGDTVTIALV